MKTYTEEEVKRIEDILHEEIRRKDKVIDELRKNNEMLLKTALKKVDTELEKNELKRSVKDADAKKEKGKDGNEHG